MPGYDKTGPMGQGAGTGRRMGPCFNNGNSVDGVTPLGRGMANRFGQGQGFGQGRGMGRGRGRGMGQGFGYRAGQAGAVDDTIEQRTEMLEKEMQILREELTTLRQQNENSDNQR